MMTKAAEDRPRSISLSVLVPVYNERYLVAESLSRLETLTDDEHLSAVEVIVVDDGSTDGTSKVIDEFAQSRRTTSGSKIKWRFIRHEHNRGKGNAIQTALAEATGDACVIHDADLEYIPSDISRMVKVYVEQSADAVFGSRFTGSEVRRALLYRHQLANKTAHVYVRCRLESQSHRRMDVLQAGADAVAQVDPDSQQ